MLAEMEAAGLGFDPWRLARRGAEVRGHMRRIEEQVGWAGGAAATAWLSFPSFLCFEWVHACLEEFGAAA